MYVNFVCIKEKLKKDFKIILRELMIYMKNLILQKLKAKIGSAVDIKSHEG